MIEQFMERFIPEPMSGCWLWTASVDRHGYGRFSLGRRGRRITAHRMAWQLLRGPIPVGLHALHRCDVRSCVNPDHIFLGTNRDNTRDAARKGRLSPQTNPERYSRPPITCSVCGRLAPARTHKRGRCAVCHQFWRRNGRERPRDD